MKNRLKIKNWKKYLFEFISIFLAVSLAFILDRWNDDRKDSIAENKILEEIYNGLERDSLDIANDEQYFKIAFRGIQYFNDVIDGKKVENDSLATFYFLFSRESIVVQNKSGYESLKSRGLETIKNDTLRSKIIDLYEVDYELARKFNEEHSEYKFMQNYFHKINDAIAPHFEYDSINNIQGIRLPIELEEKERSLLKSYLWKIAVGKRDRYLAAMSGKERIGELRVDIKNYLEQKSK
ncbi:MAG: hypothetical protein Wins2KO_11940 [Winogradskyella sp.]